MHKVKFTYCCATIREYLYLVVARRRPHTPATSATYISYCVLSLNLRSFEVHSILN